MLDKNQLRFLDYLAATVLTLWAIITVLTLISAGVLTTFSIGNALILSISYLLFGLPIVFVALAIFSFPVWFILSSLKFLNHSTMALLGGILSGLLAIYFLKFPTAYGGDNLWMTRDGNIILMISIFLGALTSWNGYRFAWNGRKRPKKVNSK